MKYLLFFLLVTAGLSLAVATPPTQPVSDPTAHQVFADVRDTTILTYLTTGKGYVVDTSTGVFQSSLSPKYRRVTRIRIFFYDTDGNRQYIQGAEYYQ